ncbi:MAG: hypothetical protein ACI4U3_01095 [Traorella sp.]
MLDTKLMNKKKKFLYDTMWGNEKFNFPVEKTKVLNGRSNQSYSFTNASSEDADLCCERLIELFEIVDKDLFRKKFHQSCSGDGKELKRISTLHSSSLCALLFFYNVTDDHPLIIKINEQEYSFTYSRFEFQNSVIKGRKPSNMDVVLVGRNASGKHVILFLESKFSEYIESVSKHLDIANEYLYQEYSKTIYTKELKKLGFSFKKTNETTFTIESELPCYLEGIKQMISHFIGVNNFINIGSLTQDDKINSLSENVEILLGEILFDRGIGNYEIEKGITCYQSYQEHYEKLTEVLNQFDSTVIVVKNLFSYSMFQDMVFVKEKKIIEFYFELGGIAK